MADISDNQIAAEVINGNIEAFKKLYERHKSLIYNTCYRYTKNEDEAVDLCQEVFLKALKSIKSFKGNSTFSLWLYRIAVNHSKNSCKRKKIVRFFSFPKNEDNENTIDPVDEQFDVEKIIDIENEKYVIHQAMQKLDPMLREIIQLRFMENKSYEEIAALCGCPAGTVGSRLSKAHFELRKAVKMFESD